MSVQCLVCYTAFDGDVQKQYLLSCLGRPARLVFVYLKAPAQIECFCCVAVEVVASGVSFQGHQYIAGTSSPQSQTPSLQLDPKNALCVDLWGSSRTFEPSRPVLLPALYRSSRVNSCRPERSGKLANPARAAKRCKRCSTALILYLIVSNCGSCTSTVPEDN